MKVTIIYDKNRISTVALIDTGAQSCCISNEKALELGLPILGKTQIGGSTGEKETDIYKIDSIELPGGIAYKIEKSIIGYEKCGNTADIILGMDLLSRGFFSISLDRRMLIAF